jgi:hypothetical protein
VRELTNKLKPGIFFAPESTASPQAAGGASGSKIGVEKKIKSSKLPFSSPQNFAFAKKNFFINKNKELK